MNKTLRWKITLMVVAILFSGISLLPSFGVKVPEWWTKYLSPGSLKLGLDLQGGMHLVLRVDLDKAIENALEFAANDLEETLREKDIAVVRTESDDPHVIRYTLPNTNALATVKQLIQDDFPNLNIKVQAEEGSFPRITLRLSDERIQMIRKNAVNQALEIIRNRIDQFGVAEPVIVRQGEDEIVVQLPGVKDPERAMKLIGRTAQLEFKM
ncbi:MAG TPA: protein translocase subunit SecDF, partial [Desulfobacterales bacterium]|nr:protein translocase subunit SecDF [Desulfobacterales bacterium]